MIACHLPVASDGMWTRHDRRYRRNHLVPDADAVRPSTSAARPCLLPSSVVSEFPRRPVVADELIDELIDERKSTAGSTVRRATTAMTPEGRRGAHGLDAVIVIAAAAVLAVAAQLTIPLPFTPVPITMSTLTVLAMGALLGPERAMLSTGLYVMLAACGAPVLAGHSGGWAVATFGYVLSYVPAAGVTGTLARLGWDRDGRRALALAVSGSAIFYVVGVPWLMAALGIDLREALRIGVVPFLIGDALKALALAAGMPRVQRDV